MRNSVLIVDDLADGRSTLEALLRADGHDTLCAASGAEAIALAAQHLPDLVLLDVMMPEMDGYETCRRMRALPAIGDVPIVMLTALDDREARLEGLEAGADDFISKPYDRVELRVRVRGTLRMNRFRRLVEGQQRFTWAIESSDVGYLELRSDGAISYVNAAAAQLLASDRAALLDAPFLEVVARRFQCEPAAAWTLPLREDSAQRYLLRAAEGSGEAQWVQVSARPEPGSGATWLRLRDVSQLQRYRRDMGMFHSAVQHKLRTPMTGLLGCTELLATTAAHDNGEQTASIATMAHDSAVKLSDQIVGVLRFLEHSTVAPPPDGTSAMAIAQVIMSIADTFPGAVAVKTAHLCGACRARISIAATEIIARELIANAHKFHPEQSPTVRVELTSDDRRITLRVIDDGVCLTAEQRARAWLPYVQGDLGTTGELPGMGLGLPLVAQLVWESGGTCELANRADGPGVEVTISVPAVSVNAAPTR